MTAVSTIPHYAAEADAVDRAIRENYVGFLHDVTQACGNVASYQRAGARAVLVNDPNLVKVVLVDLASDYIKGRAQQTTFQALLGGSLSLAEGDEHRRLRRVLSPAFSPRSLDRWAIQLVEHAEDYLGRQRPQTYRSLFHLLAGLTVTTFGHALIDEREFWDESGPFWHARREIWHWMNSVAGRARTLAGPAPAHQEREVVRATATVQQAVERHIAARQRAPIRPSRDVLDDMLALRDQASHPLHATIIRDHVLAFLFAAHETSAAALFWALYLIHRHPRAQERVTDEIRRVLGDRPAGLGDLPNMPYARAVIDEALRLYPPAGRQFRIALRDTALGPYVVPAGTPVTICHYLLHRRHAETFDPDRSATTSGLPTAIPFGAGQRVCLGRRYALLELRLLLPLVIQRVHAIFPADPIEPRLSVTLRPDTPVPYEHVR